MFLDTRKFDTGIDLNLLSTTFMEELSTIPTNNYQELINWYMDLVTSYNDADISTRELYDIEVFPGDDVNWFCAKIWDKVEKRIDTTSKNIFKKTTKLATQIPGIVRLHINIIGPNSIVPDHVDTEMNLDSEQHQDTPVYHLLCNPVVGNDGEVFIINEDERLDIKQSDLVLMPVDVIHNAENRSSSYWIALGIIIEKSAVDPFYE
jgi:hypothetical protein